MSEWQDISTAPTSNGSLTFLAYVPGHGPIVAFRYPSGDVHSASGSMVKLPRATLWQHLPEPPPDSSLTPP
jgi:hypothetical protein